MFRALFIVPTLAVVFCVVAPLAGCATLQVPPQKAALLANPASENCIRRGGTLELRKRGDGGAYGVCLFADNRECEEWAMFRGACPVGGIAITGYATLAARYCAITGGTYRVTVNGDMDREEGTCSFTTGRSCDAGDYFAGKCLP